MLSGTNNIKSNISKKTIKIPNSGSLIDSFIHKEVLKSN